MNSSAILVADDDPEVLSYLEKALLCHKYPVIAAQDGGEALSLLEEHGGRVSAVVLDAKMRCKDGIETLQEVRRRYPELPVVMLSGASDPDRIVEAIKAGAQEYLVKPVLHDKLLEAVNRTLSQRPAPVAHPRAEREAPRVSYVQANPRMRAISIALRKTAAWNVPVVLRGESGVGKEVLARELHELSPRSDKEFVKINCVALPSELLESELFGYERGAFTGAFKSKPGKFEMADGGTILLDEIGDMDLKLQAKLLQVLQDGEFHRLGGKEPVKVDVRVLVATHRDLEKAIEEGAFREDLYYRLNVVSIEVPPLRERKDEILLLAEHFLAKHCHPDGPRPELPDELKRAFLVHDWPGNVRELENVVRRYLVFEDAQRLADDLLAGRSARRAPQSAATMDHSAAAAAAAMGSSGVPATAPSSREMHAPGTTWNGAVPGQEAAPVSTYPFHNGSSHSHLESSSGQPGAMQRPAGDSFPQPEPAAATATGRAHAAAAGVGANGSYGDADHGGPDPAWASRIAKIENLLGRLIENSADEEDAEERAAESNNHQNGNPLLTLEELDEQRNHAESAAILAALDKTEWNRKKAAKLLKTDYKALLYRMKKLGIGERSHEA